MTPRLEAERLVLRPFVPSDWDAIAAMLSDAEVTRFMHFARWTAEQRSGWFAWCLDNAQQPGDDAIQWVIARKETGDAIGWFGIGTADPALVSGERVFGYLIDRAHWNQGYMTEALLAVLAYEFDTRGAPRLRATCNVANEASARVMEKAGMRREKTEYGADFEGNWGHRHHYAMTKAEYEVRQGQCAS